MNSESDDHWLPLVEELTPAPDMEAAFQKLQRLPYCLFLDSALRHPQLGRYSYLAVDPFDLLIAPTDRGDALSLLKAKLEVYRSAPLLELPPFQGGVAGLLSYDLNRSLERVPVPRFDEFGIPAMVIGLYDVILACDHVSGRAWIVSHGWPEPDPIQRRRRAETRLLELKRALAETHSPVRQRPTIRIDNLAPQFPALGPKGITSNLSALGYLEAVQQCIDYIHAGDVFQVNFAQRLLFPADDDAAHLYLRLRARNPATFAAYFDAGNFQIASASPERLLSVRNGIIEARPIKGTRRRSHWPEADLFRGDELLESEKDRAENVMIVDLLRNDLARVCLPESVRVTKLCGLETYQFVQHLVSVVEGRLAPGYEALDAIRAGFPGGSITGAPKVRAMEIIAELEPTARGPYCGSLGYIGFDGTADLSILIRTITASGGWWQLPVGGGIVAQSNPQQEYEETWHKAEGMLRALVE